MNRFDHTDHLEALTRHNALLSQQLTTKRVAVVDPIAKEAERQAKLIKAALQSLALGDPKITEEILRKL